MTTSHYTKVLMQIKDKPGKYTKYLKNNVPKERSYGKSLKRCQYCGNPRGHVGQFGINLCRRCFRDYAVELGFKKYH